MPAQHNPENCNRALQIAREADSFEAVAFLEARNDVLAAGYDYSAIVRMAYAQKNVAGMISFGLAGIHFGLSEARRRQASEPETAATLKGLAKTIACNMSANTWPGWNDEGIVLASTDLAIGMDTALFPGHVFGDAVVRHQQHAVA